MDHADSSRLGVNDAGTSGKSDTRLTHACSPDVLGFTYFIRAGDAIKIGSAVNFKHRLSTLQISHEKPLEVLAVFPAAAVDEYATHQRFAHLRTRGEWFRADRELLQYIEETKVKFGGGPPPLPIARQLSELRKKHRGNDSVTSLIGLLLQQLRQLEHPFDPEHEKRMRGLVARSTATLAMRLQ